MQKQQGMTIIGMLFTAIIVVIAAIVVMRCVPVYLHHYSIVHSIKSLNATPLTALTGDTSLDVDFLRKDLNKHLDVNGIDPLKDDELIITDEGENRYQIILKYQVVRSLVYNINLLFTFDETYEVVPGSEN